MSQRNEPAEQRSAERVAALLPVEIEGSPGCVRDISDNGVFVETEAIRDFGPMVELTLSYRAGGVWRTVTCDARVVRVEAKGERLGIAARLPAPLFDDTEPPDLGVTPTESS